MLLISLAAGGLLETLDECLDVGVALHRQVDLSLVIGGRALQRGGVDGDADESATTLPAADVFPYLEGADLVKIDIEGGEWPILSDPRFAELEARALVLEYHPHLCPGPDPRECADGLLARAMVIAV